MATEAVKKLSVKTVCGDYKGLLRKLKEMNKENSKVVSMDLMTMYGTSTGYETGTGDKGDWTALIGEFEATDI